MIAAVCLGCVPEPRPVPIRGWLPKPVKNARPKYLRRNAGRYERQSLRLTAISLTHDQRHFFEIGRGSMCNAFIYSKLWAASSEFI
jgi:hypothetical protein